ncbi:MAG: 2-oxoglutarate ferredoxin oxidoreductase subunit beta [bacterium]|jgi:2-oxoglutarate ferredoxin oxidoreductase subunit beta
MTTIPVLKRKDFTSDQEVKWCAGCGDYGVLASTTNALAKIGKAPDKNVFVSGIGCASRFPYYLSTYGFHTIHGRALPIATGMKVANPDLAVWVVMGDGDAMSIGGNHFLHAARRNVNVTVIMIDNQIYGLTKGQFSPTSEVGKVTKTSPYGSVESPIDPVKLAITAGATFVARTADRFGGLTTDLLCQAYEHQGFSFVHVMQNCVIFNDKTFAKYTGKEKSENTILLEHGKPMIFGKDADKAIVQDGFTPKVVSVNDVEKSQILVHDAYSQDENLAFFLSSLKSPLPIGLFRQVDRNAYDQVVEKQTQDVLEKKGKGNLQELLNSGDTWDIE